MAYVGVVQLGYRTELGSSAPFDDCSAFGAGSPPAQRIDGEVSKQKLCSFPGE